MNSTKNKEKKIDPYLKYYMGGPCRAKVNEPGNKWLEGTIVEVTQGLVDPQPITTMQPS